eukprot:13182988-Alexandrium_andersonii.AAC.1
MAGALSHESSGKVRNRDRIGKPKKTNIGPGAGSKTAKPVSVCQVGTPCIGLPERQVRNSAGLGRPLIRRGARQSRASLAGDAPAELPRYDYKKPPRIASGSSVRTLLIRASLGSTTSKRRPTPQRRE